MGEDEQARVVRSDLKFGPAIPILRVADFDLSIRYYLERLGFEEDWRFGRFGSVSRGRTSLMLSEGSQGCSATWLWIGIADADAFHEELIQRGANIRHPPTNYPWGSREVHVFDADRHVLRFGSEAVEHAVPGPWLDEAGVLWMPGADGSWSRVERNGAESEGPDTGPG
jgi:catechol 2,3-dioxygenase-like lactoylglutathione lyase family enzyme